MTTKRHLEVTRDEGAAADAIVYRLQGVLGESEGCFEFLEEVRNEVKSEADANRKKIVFDMKDVSFMTSAGAGIIAACYTSARNADKSFVLSSVAKQPHKVLDLTGLAAVVKCYDTDTEALAAP